MLWKRTDMMVRKAFSLKTHSSLSPPREGVSERKVKEKSIECRGNPVLKASWVKRN